MARSILVAEDDADYRLIIRLALDAVGYKDSLHIVTDGVQLIDFLQHLECPGSKAPDLIILDLNMPNKDGRQSLREIKADPSLSLIPIVILSSSDSEEDFQLSRDFNCPFIQKPGSYSRWVSAIKRALEFCGCEQRPQG